MPIELPHGGEIFLPAIPPHLQETDVVLFNYLQEMRREVERVNRALFDNTFVVATAMNSGTSGVFVILDSVNATVNITSGVVISITTAAP